MEAPSHLFGLACGRRSHDMLAKAALERSLLFVSACNSGARDGHASAHACTSHAPQRLLQRAAALASLSAPGPISVSQTSGRHTWTRHGSDPGTAQQEQGVFKSDPVGRERLGLRQEPLPPLLAHRGTAAMTAGTCRRLVPQMPGPQPG